MAASNRVRITPLQGALLGSFFLHALLFYGFTRSSGKIYTSNEPQLVTLQLVLPLAKTAPDTVDKESASTPTSSASSSLSPVAQNSPNAPSTDNVLALLAPSEPSVKKFPEIPYPSDTINISATLEIEVDLDKNGNATNVKVVKESPSGLFTEWAWEIGMKGQYSPKITTAGPVAGKLRVRLDITPGAPMEIR